jgi:hypothetical protein
MRSRSAAPGAVSGGLRGGLRTGDAADSTSFPATLAPALIERLAGHGIRNLQDWHRLSRSQRRGLFGITRRVAEQLDVIARAAK